MGQFAARGISVEFTIARGLRLVKVVLELQFLDHCIFNCTIIDKCVDWEFDENCPCQVRLLLGVH